MYETTYANYHVRHFDGIEDLIESTRRAPAANLRLVTATLREPRKLGRKFSQWEEVYAAVREGWAEGLQIVEQMAAELEESSEIPKPVSRRRVKRWSEDSGDELDYDNLRTGRPYWRASRRANVRGPQVITLVIDVNARIGIKAEDILWRGAAALAMTRILEAADYRVELYVVHRADDCYTDGSGHFHTLCLKRASEPLDVAGMVCAVSGWFYRSLMFRAKALGDKPLRRCFGQPGEPYGLLDTLGLKDPIVIGGTYSRYGAMAVAREALTKLTTPPRRPEAEPEPDSEPEAVADPLRGCPAAEPPRQKTAAELKAEAAAARKAQREYERWLKEWRSRNRES